MDPNRYWDLDAYFTATTQGMGSTITPPTSEEIAQFGSMEPPPRPSGGTTGTSAPSAGGGPTEAHGANLPRDTAKTSGSGSGATSPQEQPSGVKTSGSGPTEAHGANLPRDTAATRDARQGGGASTGSGGTSGTTSTGSGTGAAAEEPVTASSLWSQALRSERNRVNEAGGTMRDFRMPFEQHSQPGVFANYQAVAQPGRGPAVPNRMPGQPPAAAAFPNGPMPMQNGLPQRGPAPAMAPPGAPPPGIFPGRPPQGPPGAFPVQQVPQQAPAINNFSQRLQQMGAQPVMPQGFPQGPPQSFPQQGYAPQMPMRPDPRPMQSSFGRSQPTPDFGGSPFPPRDPYLRY